IGKYDEAHQHLDRARHCFLSLNDAGAVAQVDETRARTLLAENRLAEAERVVRYAVRVLQKGDQHALLAEALTTHGVALARLGHFPSARRLLQRAIEVAERTGDRKSTRLNSSHRTISYAVFCLKKKKKIKKKIKQ